MSILRRGVPPILLILLCVLFLRAAISRVPSGTWANNASMSVTRTGATATLMPDGRVLIAGGKDADGNALASAELFNTDGSITPAQAMATARYEHAATFLLDGFVVVTGGRTNGGGIVNTAEMFDPIANTWQSLPAVMMEARSGHTMAQLANGDVLIVGGENSGGPVSALEIFSLMDKSFKFGGALTVARKDAAAAGLPDGRVLIAGGTTDVDGVSTPLASTEIFTYDPDLGTGILAAGPAMSSARTGAVAAATYDGVAIVGGSDAANDLGTAEIYSQWKNTFRTVAGGTQRTKGMAILLPGNGSILVTGGSAGAQTDLLQPWRNDAAGLFLQTAPSSKNHTDGFVTPIGATGMVLVAGGNGDAGNASELYGFPTIATDKNDYAPGTTVVMTGTGWAPNEVISLHMHEWVNQTVTDYPDYSVTADADGNFVFSGYAPTQADLNSRYHLTAVGQGSGMQAQTVFTDATSFNSVTVQTQVGTVTGAGGNVTFPILVGFSGNGNTGCSVTLSLSTALPSGSSTSFSPNPVPGTSSASGSSTLTATVPSGLTPGSYAFAVRGVAPNVSGGQGCNGGTQTGNGTLNVSTSTTLTTSAATGTYGGTANLTATLTAGTSGVAGKQINFSLNGNSVGSATTNSSGVASLANATLAGINAGSYPGGVVATFAGDPVFLTSNGNASLTVNQKSVTAAITASSRPYDGTKNATTSCSVTGKVGSDDVTCSAGSALFADKNVGNGKAVTATGITLGGSTAPNYVLSGTTATTTANITAVGITVTGVTGVDKNYDGTTTATLNTASAVLNGVIAGDTVTLNAATATATFASTSASVNPIAITITGLSLSGADAGNYTLAQPSASAHINFKPVTITGVTAGNKVYDGTTAATLSGNATWSGVVAGEHINAGGTGVGTFSDRNAGSGKTVTVSGYAITGPDAANYVPASPEATLTANITPKSLTTVGLTARDKTYDATTAGALTGTAGLQATEAAGAGTTVDGKPYAVDAVSVTGTPTGTFASKNFGTAITVNVTGLSVTGTGFGNYTLTPPSLAANIGKKALTYSGLSASSSKIYDGTTSATVTGTPALLTAETPGTGSSGDGKPYLNDVVGLTGAATGSYNSKDVATGNQVTFGGITLNGTDAVNYSLTALTQAATITAKTLTYSGLSVPLTKPYNGTTTASPITGTPTLLAAEAAGAGTTTDGKPYSVDAVSLTGTPSATYNTKDIAANLVTFSGTSLTGTGSANYSLTALTQAATITAADLHVNGVTTTPRVYDGTTAVTINVAGASLVTVFGADSVTLNSASASGQFLDKNVGNAKAVTVTGLSLSGVDAPNYNLIQPTGVTGSITPAHLTVQADDASRTYGDPNATFAATLSGFISGENLGNSGVTGTAACTSAATATSPVPGPYLITCTVGTLAATNYDFVTFNSGSLTITARHITVTANDKSKTYGDSDPAFTFTVSGSGLASGETNATVFTGALLRSGGESVAGGPYAINQGTLVANSNYQITTFNTGHLAIDPKPASVTPTAVTKTYGDLDPAFTGALAGFLTGDNVIASYSRTVGETVAGSPYTISATLSPVGVLSNYNITYNTAQFTISPRPASVTPAAASKTYGDGDPALTGALLGFVAGDNVTATYSRTTGESVAGSPYTISATLAPAGALANYTITYNTAAFTINQRAASVTPAAASKTYGDNDSALTGTLSGFLAADNVTAAYTRTSGETVLGSPYTISATLSPTGVLSNYNISYNTASFTITPRAASVTPNADNKIYGAADPGFTGTLAGFIAGDNVNASYSRTAGETVAGSPYTISATLSPVGVLSNYNITYNTASFTVTPRAASVTPDADSKIYGAADPGFTGTLVGFLAGDNVNASYSRTAGETVAGSPYTISATLSPAGVLANYAITYNTAAFTINQRPASVTPAATGKTYGDNDPGFTGTLAGFLAGDNVNASYSRTAGETVAGSPYTISATLSPAGVLSNYVITYNTAGFTITPRAITVTPTTGQHKIYGDSDPALTFAVGGSGLATGDDVATVFAGALARAVGESVAGSPYPINQGTLAASNNYTITSFTAGVTFAIGVRPITVTADAKTKVYGDVDPGLTYQITSGSLAFNDVLSGALARAVGESVGSYAITQGTLALNSNYALTFAGANLTIAARPITVTADPKSKVYGDSDPGLTYQISSGSLAFSDSFTGSLTRDIGESVGAYAIKQATLALNSNYALTYVAANLTITKRPITVTADSKTKIYGQPDPALTYRITSGSLAFGDTFTGSLARDPGEGVGTYTIKVGTLALSGNYTLTYVSANLTITPWTANGFYQPVTMSTSVLVWNTIKGGSTVPLKFNIYAGSVEQTSTSAVTGSSLVVTEVSCAINGYEDPITEVISNTGGTSLRYDTSGAQFIQNWQTPKPPGKCYVVRMLAKDAVTKLDAYFKTK